MGIITLKQSQKNTLFEEINYAQLSPYNFILTERDENGLTSITLSYKGSSFFYCITIPDSGGFFSSFSPGDTYSHETRNGTLFMDVQMNFRKWLKLLRLELNEPDLWEKVMKYELPDEIKSISSDENSRFTYEEVIKIKEGLNQLKIYFTESLELQSAHQEEINRKIDYLIESSEKQGRRDFLYMVIGNIISIISPLAVTPENAEYIWGTVKNMFVGLVNALPQ